MKGIRLIYVLVLSLVFYGVASAIEATDELIVLCDEPRSPPLDTLYLLFKLADVCVQTELEYSSKGLTSVV